ncbi:MAG: tripartite tricarboxylate transporter substrate binding protein [Zoogloeaceae bacterium]|jgi:tripartite-type tricarboxylate transporter receptor subunit TctC|nr:tripartite tricarboxylate transporter substrate binding protein [Zoogloeaceae bacterium]
MSPGLFLSRLFAAAGISFLMASAFPAFAGDEVYPNHVVKVIVPYPAGGIVDISARIVAESLAREWGQSIVIENRPGANGNIGAAAVKKAAADGYTLLVGSTFLTTNSLLDSTAKISAKDFLPIGTLGLPPNLMVVPAAFPAGNLKEFVALAKQKPGQFNAANPGNGSSNHLGTEIFEAVAGIDLTLIGYSGQPPFLPDLLNGRIDFAVASAGLVGAHIRDGKLRPLAVGYDKRLKNYPELPTLEEQGYPDAMVLPWVGFFAPKGTPDSIRKQWAFALKKALRTPEVIRKYEAMEAVNPEFFLDAFASFLEKEDARWRRVTSERHLNRQNAP